jgi:hypothetical protein
MKDRTSDYDELQQITNVNFEDPTYVKHAMDESSENYIFIRRALLCLSICHTVIIEKQEATNDS